jgi:hypothetical protein
MRIGLGIVAIFAKAVSDGASGSSIRREGGGPGFVTRERNVDFGTPIWR